MNNLSKRKNKGLALLEFIVAIAIFSIIITIVVSLFMTTLRGYRKTVALQNVQENARFLLDFMAKEIRQSIITSTTTGQSYYLSITRPDAQNITYSFDGANIQRTVVGSPSSSGPINSEEVVITGRFFISGTTGGAGGDGLQPVVTIALRVQGQGVNPEERAAINLQTTLSQRNLDL